MLNKILLLLKKIFNLNDKQDHLCTIDHTFNDDEMESIIIRFYKHKHIDEYGQKLQEIWEWSDSKLEGVHNYIQWLFPTDIKSQFNFNSPTLTPTDIIKFKTDSNIISAVDRSYKVFLSFLGLIERNGKITTSNDFEKKFENWLTPRNHNYLRISRLIRFLRLLGRDKQAFALYDFLSELKDLNPELLNSPHAYWKKEINFIHK